MSHKHGSCQRREIFQFHHPTSCFADQLSSQWWNLFFFLLNPKNFPCAKTRLWWIFPLSKSHTYITRWCEREGWLKIAPEPFFTLTVIIVDLHGLQTFRPTWEPACDVLMSTCQFSFFAISISGFMHLSHWNGKVIRGCFCLREETTSGKIILVYDWDHFIRT